MVGMDKEFQIESLVEVSAIPPLCDETAQGWGHPAKVVKVERQGELAFEP